MTQAGENHLRINRTIPSFEEHAARNDSNHPVVAHKAVFEKSPLAVPADHARVNLEDLKDSEVN